MKSYIITNEFKNQRKWVPKECEIMAKDFPDPVCETVSVFPLENHTLPLTFYFVFGGKKYLLGSKVKVKREHRQS